jgi:hypothetical protein
MIAPRSGSMEIRRLPSTFASGTGVKVEHGTFTGDIEIRGVRAGVKPSDPAKDG